MTTNERDKNVARHRRSGVEEEQLLCNEALKSLDLDELSDADWITMCEEAAAKVRKPATDQEP